MRPIDADALVEAIKDYPYGFRGMIVCDIAKQPTIEPKKGMWMAIGNTGLASCKCGYITDRYSIYNYCPKCGARMENDDEA